MQAQKQASFCAGFVILGVMYDTQLTKRESETFIWQY